MANLRVNKITGTEVFETTGSVQFDGTTDFLTISSNTDFAMGTGDFTAECWIYLRGYSDAEGGYSERVFDSNTGQLGIYITSDGTGYVGALVGGTDIRSSTAPDLQSWSHLAISRSGTTFRIFLNGTQILSRENSSSVASSGNFLIGARASGEGGFRGHISNFRILKGTALYTKNFTPPTRELTVIPNTVLLCCQSTTRANEERTGKTITVNGNAVANELTPGLLTDRIRSGGSSSISGSVEFNGTGDYLTTVNSNENNFGSSDFTIEFWINSTKTTRTDPFGWNYSYNNAGWAGFIFNLSASGDMAWYENANSRISASSTGWNTGSWNHISICRSGDSVKMFLNGIQVGSTYTTSFSYGADNTGFIIGKIFTDPIYVNGFISNLRVIKGTALYTQNFIPPTRELKNLPGTVLLCCQNSKSATQEATGKTITVNGNATARYFTPPVGFDGFVNFDGATKIKSPNYFYLPTGTTEDRGGARGVFGGGTSNVIDYITISSTGNATDFGDLTITRTSGGANSSSTRGLFGGGYSPISSIDYITIASTGNAQNFGNLTSARERIGATSNATRGLFAGQGTDPATVSNVIDYVTISSTGNAVDFGDLTVARGRLSACSSPTRGIFIAGSTPNSSTDSNIIDFVTISTLGNATDFGDTTVQTSWIGSSSNSIRGINSGGSLTINTISYITISSLGNAINFGQLTVGRRGCLSTSSSTRGVFGGGYSPGSYTNTIEYVTISATGNAVDFGDLTTLRGFNGACSNAHGGLG